MAGTDFVSTDDIACVLTSNAICASPTTATSAAITMTVNSVLTPSVAIAITTGANPACTGSSLTFAATPTNGGATPTYQWYNNGAAISGETNDTYTGVAGTDFVSTNTITCVLTSNAVCASPATATSAGITMTVNPVLTPSVAIAITAGANPACNNSSVTFRATPTNGGVAPTYQWRKNGTNISGATNATYTAVAGTDFVSTNTITCVLTSNVACASPTTATSAGITMTVNPVLTPSVAIAITTGANPACAGSSLTFTATPTNGGVAPTYQWRKNGTNISGATNATYTAVAGTDFVSTNTITCVLTSNAICANPITATSAGITMTVTPNVVPTVAIAITAGANPACTGSSLTFAATPTNGGATPTYQWYNNGTAISGETNATYTAGAGTDFVSTDDITCVLTSNAICANPITATSAAITMTVNSVLTPSVAIAITTGANPACAGSSLTFAATPTDGGATPTYQWYNNGAAISGETNATYTAGAGTDFVSTDDIACVLTSNAICASPTTATSAGITMTVNPVLTPSVAIAITTGANPACAGSSLTFTATPTNGGVAPTYQWRKNGTNISGATNATYTGVAGTDFVSTNTITLCINK